MTPPYVSLEGADMASNWCITRLSKTIKNTKNNNFGNKKGESWFIGSLKNNKWVG